MHVVKQAPFMFFWAAVVITIWYGGLRGGLLAIGLTAFITGVVFQQPPFSLQTPDSAALLTFIVLTGLISWFVDRGRQAEIALRQSEQEQGKLAAIVNASDDAIISKNLDAIIESWNPGAERMYGYRAEEVIGKPITILVPPDMPDEIPQIMERLKRGERIDHYETQRVTKDGRRLHVSLSTSPLRDAHGRVIGAAKIARDVTQQKMAEAAIKNSEQRFRTMADTVPGCVWTARPDGSIDYANRYWYEFSGLTEEQTAGSEWASILHPDDQERTLDTWMTAMRNGTPYELEARNRRADGEWRWLLNRAVPVKDDQGNIVAWFGTSMDVTDLKRTEEALRQSEERLRTVLENMPVMLAASDTKGIILWNRECERVTGYSAAEIIGNPRALELLYPDADYRQEVLSYLREQGGDYRNFEAVITTKAGEQRHIAWSSVSRQYPVFDWTTWAVGVDITPRKQAQAALRESEARYRLLFEDSPVSLWEQDFSEVKAHLEQLRARGIEDLSAYLDEHPEDIATCINKVRVLDVNKAAVALYGADSKAELLSRLVQVVPPEGLALQKSFVLAVAEGKTKLNEELFNRTLTGEDRWISLSWSVVAGYEDSYGKVLVSIIDITERKRARDQAEQRAERIESLQAIAAALSQAMTAEEIARVVVDQGLVALKAANGAVNLLVDDTFEVTYASSRRMAEDEGQAWRSFPANPAFPATEAVKTRQPLWLESLEERNERFPAIATLSEIYPGAWAMVPLLVGQEVIGVVGWTFDHNRTFNDEERAFMLALGQQCAQALERARLYEQEKHKAVLEERQRIARDLHDAVSQTLFAANVMAQSLPRLWERQRDTIPRRLEELARLTQGAASEMRVLLLELRPTVLLESKLPDLLGQLVQIAQARKRDIAISLSVEGNGSLPPDVHVTFYRVAQETLNNIVKHSGAVQAMVRLSMNDERAELYIRDDGKGFNLENNPPGFGLEMMRERAQEIGAALRLTSQAGQGTEVALVWQAARRVGQML